MSFKGFFSIFSSGGHFRNFDRGSPKEHFCEIILKSGHWPWRRCHLKVFLLVLAAILFWGVEPISVKGHPRNISVKLF